MEKLAKTTSPFSLDEELEYCAAFTNEYRKNLDNDAPIREASCLAIQFPQSLGKILSGDPFAGRLYGPLVQFSPQPDIAGLGYCIDEARASALLSADSTTPSQKLELQELLKFWTIHQTKQHVKNNYTDDINLWLSREDYFNERAVAHALYRMSGSQLDYATLLTLGIDGLRARIADNERGNAAAKPFYKALHSYLDIFSKTCESYIAQIEIILAESDAAADVSRLKLIAASLKNISHSPPQSLFEAIQLTYLWWLMSGSLNLARMDTYLAKYYTNDIDTARITEDEALEYMQDFWRMLEIRNKMYDTRVVLGGKGRDNEAVCDRFCLLAINATRRHHSIVPQVALRTYSGMNPQVFDVAMTAISEGCTFPMLYNDDVNIAAVASAFNVPADVAANYCPYGCGEYVLERQSIGTPSGIINLTKALEMALNHGIDFETNDQLAPDFGGLDTYTSFDELLLAYKKTVEHFVALLAKQEEIEYTASATQAAFLGLSMLYDDCIARGKALLSGGVRYLGGTLESYGNVNAADSLLAIKKAVFESKSVSAGAMLHALKQNFDNHDDLRLKLISYPKYGNDDDEADAMLIAVHNHICDYTRESVKGTIMHSYLTVVINNDANTVLGHLTSASADGRQSGMYLANANNPQGGADKSGLTAMLNSIAKPAVHHHAGAVQNLKLSKDMFADDTIAKTAALIKTYFAIGGAQIMITVVSAGEMQDAIKNPDKHRNLIVRVGGFSARFVELGADVQQELLSRCLHG